MMQEYMNFLVEKEKTMAQYNMLEEIVELVKNGMDINDALRYEIDKTWDRIEELRPLEEKYKRRKFLAR